MYQRGKERTKRRDKEGSREGKETTEGRKGDKIGMRKKGGR